MQVLDKDGLDTLVEEIYEKLREKVSTTRTINGYALLDNINLNAQDVGAIAGVQKNGFDLETDEENKVNIDVPEKTSDLINDSGYVTEEDINYTGGTGISVDGKVINHMNSIKAGTVSGSSGEVDFGAKVDIPTISYDSEGHIVDTGVTTITLPIGTETDEMVATDQNNTTKAYITGTVHSGSYIGTLIYDSNIYLDTTAGTLTAKIFNGDLTGNADTATVATTVKITNTNPESATSYYIPFGSISSNALTAGYNNGLQYRTLQGTTSAYGYGGIYLGNSTASGNSGNKYGFLRFYGRNTNYWTLSGNRDVSSNYTVYMPNSGGSLVVATTDAAVGSTTQPVYINSSGVATPLSSSVGTGVTLMYLDNGVFTASLSSLGNMVQPIYLNAGSFSVCTVTDNSAATALTSSDTLVTTRAVYFGLPTINGSHAYSSATTLFAPTSAGTSGYVLTSSGGGAPGWNTPESLTVGIANQLGTADVGSGTKPIYLNKGVATASSSTVGGSAVPIYLSSGTITACSVTDATSATALTTANSVPTTRAIYYGLPVINGVHTYNSSTAIYAPTTEGTNGYVLTSTGSGAPNWMAQESLSVGTANKIGTATVGSSSTPIYLNGGSPTACGYSFSDYLPLSGGTMSGSFTQLNLTISDGRQTIACINLYDEGSTSGSEMVIGANGNMFIGSGESYKNLRTEFQDNGTASGEAYSATSERLYVTADTNMYFYSNGNTIGSRLGIAYDSDGAFRPLVTGTRSLGTSSIHWATAFIDEIEGTVSNAKVAEQLGTSTVGSGTQPIYLNSGVVTASTSTVGSATKPVFLNSGVITASGSTVGSGVIPTYLSSGTITASTSTVGSGTKPIYLSSGTLTVSSSTVGSGTVPVYLSSGTITASGSTVGSGVIPMYLNNGTFTASSSTVGSGVIPVYLNSGTLTASSTTSGSTTQPIFLNSGSFTPISATVGSTTQPVYLNAGVITAMSGALSTTYGGTGNTSGRATFVSVTNTNPTSSTSYYPVWVTGTSSNTDYSTFVNNGFRYNTLQGDSSTDGYGRLYLGNSTASGESGNKYGMIRFYGLGENYWTLSGNKDISSNYTIYFPSSGGGLVVSSYGSAVGSGTKPVYISSSGVATASSSTVGSGVIPTYLSSGTITASTSTVGSSIKPIYLNAGTITVSNSTVGSSTQPVYLNSGTITACSTTVGSGTKLIYSNSGVLTVSSSTVGSATTPVYLNAGTITACSNMVTSSQLTDGSVTKVGTATVGGTAQGIYLSSGTPTALSATIGSTAQPVYMSSGTITACSTTVGSGTKPVYSNSGVLTASSSTVGSSTTPVYMSSGTITAGSEMVTLSEARTYTDVTLSISDWSGTSAPYSQSVTVTDMDGSSWFFPSVVYPSSCSRAEQKTIAKSAAYIYEAEGGSGTVTFRATEKPTVALTIRIQGVI